MSRPKLLHTHSTLPDRSYLTSRRPSPDAYSLSQGRPFCSRGNVVEREVDPLSGDTNQVSRRLCSRKKSHSRCTPELSLRIKRASSRWCLATRGPNGDLLFIFNGEQQVVPKVVTAVTTPASPVVKNFRRLRSHMASPRLRNSTDHIQLLRDPRRGGFQARDLGYRFPAEQLKSIGRDPGTPLSGTGINRPLLPPT